MTLTDFAGTTGAAGTISLNDSITMNSGGYRNDWLRADVGQYVDTWCGEDRIIDVINRITLKNNEPKQEKKDMKNEFKYGIPEVKSIRVVPEGRVTIVNWTDGTYTSVRHNPDENTDMNVDAGIAIAMAKKMFGSTSKFHKYAEEHMESHVNAKIAADKQKVIDEQNRNHLRKVQKIAKKMRLEEEAKAYNKEKNA